MFDRPAASTIHKPKDREWTMIEADKLFEEFLRKETGKSDASTDTKTYGRSLWTFLGGVLQRIERVIYHMILFIYFYLSFTYFSLSCHHNG